MSKDPTKKANAKPDFTLSNSVEKTNDPPEIIKMGSIQPKPKSAGLNRRGFLKSGLASAAGIAGIATTIGSGEVGGGDDGKKMSSSFSSDCLVDYHPTHEGIVNTVAIAPDGSILATGGDNVKVWNVYTGLLQTTYSGHRRDVNSVAFAPDGRTIASGGEDNSVQIWDAVSGELLITYTEHSAAVNCVAFSPDGTTVASASFDNTVRLWDSVSGETILVQSYHSEPVRSVAFSPDGASVASGSDDRIALIWDSATGEPVHILLGDAGPITSVAFSSDGERLAVGTGTKVQIWNTATAEMVASYSEMARSVAFSPDGAKIVISTHGSRYDDHTNLLILNTASGDHFVSYFGHYQTVNQAIFSPDGSFVVSASNDQTVQLWGAENGNFVRFFSDESTRRVEYPFLCENWNGPCPSNSACNCNTVCSCDAVCSCDTVCTCDGQGGGCSYWHPN